MNVGRAVGVSGKSRLATETENLPRQIVTLAFPGNQTGSFISEQLARTLCAQTEAPVVLVHLEHADGGSLREQPVRPELFLNGEFHLPAVLDKTEAGFHSLPLGVGTNPPTPPGIASLVEQLSRHFRYVLIEARVDEESTPWVSELLCRSNLAYVFANRASASIRQLDLLMRETRA